MKITHEFKKNAMYLLAGLVVGAVASWQIASCYKESQEDMYTVGYEIARNGAVFSLFEHYQNTGNTNVADILKENINDYGDFSYTIIDIIDYKTQIKEKKIDPLNSDTWMRYDPTEKDRLILHAAANGNNQTLLSVLNLHSKVLISGDKNPIPSMNLSEVSPKYIPHLLMQDHIEKTSNLSQETLSALSSCKSKLEKISKKKTWIEMSRQYGSCSKIIQSSLYAELDKVANATD